MAMMDASKMTGDTVNIYNPTSYMYLDQTAEMTGGTINNNASRFMLFTGSSSMTGGTINTKIGTSTSFGTNNFSSNPRFSGPITFGIEVNASGNHGELNILNGARGNLS